MQVDGSLGFSPYPNLQPVLEFIHVHLTSSDIIYSKATLRQVIYVCTCIDN